MSKSRKSLLPFPSISIYTVLLSFLISFEYRSPKNFCSL